MLKSVMWLLKCQNEDGGFGESTLSYVDKNWAGKGKSTPSQTAWALLALIEYYNFDSKFKGNNEFRFVLMIFEFS